MKTRTAGFKAKPRKTSKGGLFRPGVRLDASQVRDLRGINILKTNPGGTPSRETRARIAAKKINAGRGAISQASQSRGLNRRYAKPSPAGFQPNMFGSPRRREQGIGTAGRSRRKAR